MLNVLIDTNVALDFILHRQPLYPTAETIIETANFKIISAYVSAASVTDVYYLARRELRDRNLALQLLKNFLKIVKVAAVFEKEIDAALNLSWRDFEDAVQYSVAKSNEMDYIITRNTEDFSGSEISVITPEDFIKILLED